LQARYGASERQVCFALRVSRSSFRYRSVAADDSALRLRIREITETRVHYGYRRVHVMLRREGWPDNHKRIYRLYCEQGLSLRLKRPRRNKSAQRRQPQPQGLYPNHVWGMDFVSDALFDGRRLRLLTVIDLYTRECLGICVGQNLRSTEVAEMLNSIALRRPILWFRLLVPVLQGLLQGLERVEKAGARSLTMKQPEKQAAQIMLPPIRS
jgi:putative transposase